MESDKGSRTDTGLRSHAASLVAVRNTVRVLNGEGVLQYGG